MDYSEFNPDEFYATYPAKVISRPGYPARAQYKSTLMWDLWGTQIMEKLDHNCQNYADIGGCFGFGANALAYQIFHSQGFSPKTSVFEIVPEFVNIGKQLFPQIKFMKADFRSYDGEPDFFDLISLFDVIEHIKDPESFLSTVANKAKLVLMKTPMETGGEIFGGKTPMMQGCEHPDGHINFFSTPEFIKLLNRNGLDVIRGKFIKSVIPIGADRILQPELSKYTRSNHALEVAYRLMPAIIKRKIFGGGEYLCLARSRLL